MKFKMCEYCDREIKSEDNYCVQGVKEYHLECYPKRKLVTSKWEKYTTIIWSIFGIVCAILGVIIGLIYAFK